MNKRFYFVVLGILVLAVVFGASGLLAFRSWSGAKTYSVVYLSTGEIYVGHLSTFPRLELRDAYLFLTAKDSVDPTKSNFQISPLSDTLWSPTTLYLNRRQVIFYGPLSETSKIAEALRVKK